MIQNARTTAGNTKETVGRNDGMNEQEMSIEKQETEHPIYSIIAPVFNEVETLPHFYERIIKVMEDIGEPFELVLVNDGSRDGSYKVMQDLHSRDPRVHVIDFSRNFGHRYRLFA